MQLRASGYTRASEYNRRLSVHDDEAAAAEDAAWRAAIAKRETRAQRSETIGRAYDGAVTRGIRIEAKAVGLLQIVAIGFAIVALAVDRRMWLLQLLSTIAVIYLSAATLGAVQVLRSRARRQVVSVDARDATGGLLQTALAAAALERDNPVAANLLDGVLRDLVAGFGAAVVALMLTICGVGRAQAGSRAVEPAATTSSTTSLPVSTLVATTSPPATTAAPITAPDTSAP